MYVELCNLFSQIVQVHMTLLFEPRMAVLKSQAPEINKSEMIPLPTEKYYPCYSSFKDNMMKAKVYFKHA